MSTDQQLSCELGHSLHEFPPLFLDAPACLLCKNTATYNGRESIYQGPPHSPRAWQREDVSSTLMKLDMSRYFFLGTAAAAIVGLALVADSLGDPTWLKASTNDPHYTQKYSVGLYESRWQQGNDAMQTAKMMWCGDRELYEPTQWCRSVRSVRGLVISSIVFSALGIAGLVGIMGRRTKAVAFTTSLMFVVAAALAWAANGMWGVDIKDSYCHSLVPNFRIISSPFVCNYAFAFTLCMISGFLFLFSAIGTILVFLYPSEKI